MVKVSILIITRDRVSVLIRCLEKIHPQVRDLDHEVVIVDSSEGNQTEEVLRNFSWVRYFRISLPRGTRPQSYSYGVKAAQGEIVVFLDDDSMVHPGWLEALESCFDDPEIGAAGGRVLSNKTVSSLMEYKDGLPVGRIFSDTHMISNLHLDTGKRIEVDTVRGCNMALRKKMLEKTTYFDPRLKGSGNIRVEDDVCTWVRRMGYRVVFEPQAVVLHLAAPRADSLGKNLNLKAEFYARRNTVWFFVKHFKFSPYLVFNVMFWQPLLRGMRRICGGSLKKPRLNPRNLIYILTSIATLAGVLWGGLISVWFCFRNYIDEKYPNDIPKLDLAKQNRGNPEREGVLTR